MWVLLLLVFSLSNSLTQWKVVPPQCFSHKYILSTNVTLRERQTRVRDAFIFAYSSYEDCCYGADEIRPVTGDSRQNPAGSPGLGGTILDCLDSLMLFGLHNASARARRYVAEVLQFDTNVDISVFESLAVGGLLSAFELSGDDIYLQKAYELSSKILKMGFHESGLPYTMLNLGTGRTRSLSGASAHLSEVATLSVEWLYLSHHTGDRRFADAARNIVLGLLPPLRLAVYDGHLYPNFVSMNGKEGRSVVSLGALGDSAYEYLMKAYALSSDERFLELFDEALEGIVKWLLRKTRGPMGLTYLAELINGQVKHKMDHLVCFLPGTISMRASMEKKGSARRTQLTKWAEEILRTCIAFYKVTTTGLGPEIAYFRPDSTTEDIFIRHGWDSHYFLRPEVVESLFYLYRHTGKQEYREIGWQIFLSIEKYCKTDVAFSGIRDVRSDNPEKNDVMESFFLTETLKYLYLLFGPDEVIPLDRYVFNTEAHPLSAYTENLSDEFFHILRNR